ncbi:flagellar hook-associated protein FlgK [Solidesulfovibrio carbinoliphilus subsp. oakridgensis]|uniref:Flagellar hook-associated protein 1 n=1 Tax=Solidesulfovibrio carbinoliphilus subsp. oakridgensis TaxID=694327 RepID=G7QCP4_9BACT|nr:flagellar hook-associated protein FlgK [Solidesulfovibrio carbinoliphilus]EHJ46200.1 flagellar hook-associated protein FlgK [Solidesulfovibrio carbinoliphilus subsp. oakridgensis]
MSSLSSLLSIGRSALSTSQAALQVTGNNIANVDTEGYSKQTLITKDGSYVSGSAGQLGSGVVAQEVVRSHDQFIEAQYLQRGTARDRFQTLYAGLSSMQNLVNESNSKGVNASLSNLFGDWGDLTGNTDSAATRQTMLDDTNTLLGLYRSMSSSIEQLRSQADQAIAADVETVNQLAKDIADLNKQINSTQVDGQNIPNGLYDARDKKIRELSALVDVNVIDNGRGNLTVNTNAGQTIVDGMVSYEFKYEQGKTVRQLSSDSITAGSDVQAYYEGSDTSEYTLRVKTSGGLGGVGGATFEASLDGGKTWLTNDDGTVATFQADGDTGKVKVGDLDVWFGSTTDPTDATGTLEEGDTFTLVPKKALYWYTTAGTPVNVTPQQYGDGTDNPSRLTGGSLTGTFLFRDEELGSYQKTLDAMAKSLVWEVNRIHSQGAGLTPFTEVQGSYSVNDSTAALSSAGAGLAFGDRLEAGSFMMYVYDADGKLATDAATGEPIQAAIQVDTGDLAHDSLDDIVASINTAFSPTYLTASVVNGRLSIASATGSSFRFGDDSSGALAALGVNTLLTGSTAGDVAVNSVVASDTNKVCVGHVGADGLLASGDNTTAKALAALEDKDISFYVTGQAPVSQTLGEYYSGLVGKIGSDTANASYQASYQSTLAAQLDAAQLSASGVNLDEELTNMIKFQHSYQAAAKLISTADQLMETVLGLKN